MVRHSKFTFHYVGEQGGHFAFRAPTWPTARRNQREARLFQNAVTGWALSTCDAEDWKAGNGAAPGFEELGAIANRTGSTFCLLLRRLGDVARLERAFRVQGLDPATLASPEALAALGLAAAGLF